MKLATLRIIAAALALMFLSGVGNRTAAARGGFSLKSLKGAYAGIFSGKINTGEELLPLYGTGVFTSDGNGNLTGRETYTVDTTPCDATIAGTYTVNADGTGTNSITFTTSLPGCTSGSYTQTLAIAEHGALILLSNTNGDQVNEEWHSQK